MLLLLSAILMLSSASAQGPLLTSRTYSFTGVNVSGIDYSLPLNAKVSLSNRTASTYVTIEATADVLSNASVMVSPAGILSASLAHYVQNPSGTTVDIQVPVGSLSLLQSPGTQMGANGNLTVAGEAINAAAQLKVYASGSALISIVNASAPSLLANIANRTPFKTYLMEVTGIFPEINYTGGPYTQSFIGGFPTAIAVNMNPGSSLNISSASGSPNITGTYASSGSTVGGPGYIYYNTGSCNVQLTGQNITQSTACVQAAVSSP